MTAGLATLNLLQDGQLLNELNKRGDNLRQKLSDIFERNRVDAQVTGVGSLLHTHFTREKVKDVRDVFRADRGKLSDYHKHLIMNGVFFLPTRTGALSTSHSENDIEKLLTKAEIFAKKN